MIWNQKKPEILRLAGQEKQLPEIPVPLPPPKEPEVDKFDILNHNFGVLYSKLEEIQGEITLHSEVIRLQKEIMDLWRELEDVKKSRK